jgi:predicted transcriptional regulator
VTKRILRIGIASREYIHDRMLGITKGAIKPRATDPRLWFTSYEALARVFSKTNIMLIEILREKELASVTELAKQVGKEKTNVLRSLKLLEEFEIVQFEEGEGGRRAPRLKYDDFETRMYSRARAMQ